METKRKGTSRVARHVHRTAFGNRDEVVESIVSKLIVPQGKENSPNHTTHIPSQNELMPLMRDAMQRAHDADYAFEILSDLELAAQFAISSMLSSKDLITTSLIYECPNLDIPLDLRSEMIRVVTNYFDDDYKLPTYLYDILYESLFKSGAYAAAIIPESSIDAVIKSGRNGTATESFKEAIRHSLTSPGILGSPVETEEPKGFGFESLYHREVPLTDENCMIAVGNFEPMRLTDNLDVLKLPKVTFEKARKKVASTYNVGLEVFDLDGSLQPTTTSTSKSKRGADVSSGVRLDQTDNSTYNRSSYQNRIIEDIPKSTNSGRPNVGHPLVQHLPTESVIPVHVPGDFKLHVGYLVLLDRLGNPISRHDLVNSTQAWTWISGDASSQLIKGAAEGLGIKENSQEKWTISKLTQAYSELVEQNLINSLRNGVYGDGVTVTRPQEVYRIMMARALAKKQTQILYIPVEQLTYFAFDYTDAGMGRSLTDRNKTTIAARAAVMFAAQQASILNATRTVQYDIKLAPEDREGEKSVDDYKHRIMQGHGGRIPFTGSIDDMEAYFMNAGVTFNIEGNDYYPDMKVGISDVTPDYKPPDDTLIENLAKNNYRGFGIDPDLILSPQSIEYASQVVSKDLIATKQTVQRQEKFQPLITHFVRTYIRSSGPLMGDLADAILTHLKGTNGEDAAVQRGTVGKYLNRFINFLDVSLPKPDLSMLQSQLESWDKEKAAIEPIIEAFMDEEFISQLGVDIDVRAVQTMVKSFYARNWFRKNGACPELLEIFDNREMRADYIKSMADDNVNMAEFIYKAISRAASRVGTVTSNNEVPENAPKASGGGGDEYGDSDEEGDGDGFDEEGDGDGFDEEGGFGDESDGETDSDFGSSDGDSGETENPDDGAESDEETF